MKPTAQNDLRLHYQVLLGLEAPWKVAAVQMDLAASQVEISLDHPGEQPLVCPKCGAKMTRHDEGRERTWRHLDTMRFTTLLRAKVRRGTCAEHGVLTVAVPWAGKSSRTTWLVLQRKTGQDLHRVLVEVFEGSGGDCGSEDGRRGSIV